MAAGNKVYSAYPWGYAPYTSRWHQLQNMNKHKQIVTAVLALMLLAAFTYKKEDRIIKQTTEKSYMARLVNGEYEKMENSRMPKVEKFKQYSKKGLITQMKLVINDNPGSTVKISYGENDLMITQNHYDQNNKLTKKVIRESDSLIVSYDSEMNKISQDIERKISDFETYTKTTNYKNGTVSTSTVKRDSSLNVIYVKNEFVFNNDTTKNETFVKYDDFDENGNWMTSLYCNNTNFDTVQVKTRTIEYY